MVVITQNCSPSSESTGADKRVFQLWKSLKQAKTIPTYSLLSCYKGGFGQNMSMQKVVFILGVSPSAVQATIKTAHRRTIVLNYPDKEGLAYLAI